MKVLSVKKHSQKPTGNKVISRKEIEDRLVDIDLAQTSAIRDLELDVSGNTGIPVDQVVEETRQLLAK